MLIITLLVLMASYRPAHSTSALVNIALRRIIDWIRRVDPLPIHREGCHGASHAPPPHLPQNHRTAREMATE